MWIKGSLCALLVRILAGGATVENMEMSQKIKNRVIYDQAILLLGIYLRKVKEKIYEPLCSLWHDLQQPKYGNNLNAYQ